MWFRILLCTYNVPDIKSPQWMKLLKTLHKTSRKPNEGIFYISFFKRNCNCGKENNNLSCLYCKLYHDFLPLTLSYVHCFLGRPSLRRRSRLQMFSWQISILQSLKPYVNHTGWIAVVAATDRPKSVHNRCVIERFCSVFMLRWLQVCTVCRLEVFAIRLRRISSLFSPMKGNLQYLKSSNSMTNICKI